MESFKYSKEVITESAEQFLANSEILLRTIFDSLHEAIFFVTPDRKLIKANKAASAIFGYSNDELFSLSTQALHVDEEHFLEFGRKIKDAFQQDKVAFFEFEAKRKSGEIFPTEHTVTLIKNERGLPLGILSVVRDISERKNIEQQLRQKYKMEAVGVMAAGMAHNFNNNLSIILGNLELAKLKLSPQNNVGKFLDSAKTAVLRSRDLVKQIMSYSRKGSSNHSQLQLSFLLKETVSLIRSTIPSSIKLTEQMSAECEKISINGDSSQIQECLLNLCNNAVHAMEEKGELLLRLEQVDLGHQDISPQYDCSPGKYLRLSVQDNGCGIPADHMEKIFDPFFTTKELHEGTGLGLSSIQGIVNKHGGMIFVASQEGEGTIFQLYFPVLDQRQKEEGSDAGSELQRGSGSILFVDDDEMITELYERLLAEIGYQVTVKADSTEALKHFMDCPDRYDLVITDQTMPGLTGKDLLEEIKKYRPDMPTVLCTGYSNKINEEEAARCGISHFLMKPIDFHELSQMIRAVLEDKSTG